MKKMKVEQFVVGAVVTNCYIAINEETRQAFIVDPGDDGAMLIGKINGMGLKLQGVLLTHGHFDHASAAEEIAKAFGVSVYAHVDEKETLTNPGMNLSGMVGQQVSYKADILVTEGLEFNMAGFAIKVFHTPGHTPGGCCYYIQENKTLFSGDTLFCESIGRTDFPGGSTSKLVHSVHDKLFVLPDDVTVYPGHNEVTSIGWEKTHNLFL